MEENTRMMKITLKPELTVWARQRSGINSFLLKKRFDFPSFFEDSLPDDFRR
jgi:hypothetical protein